MKHALAPILSLAALLAAVPAQAAAPDWAAGRAAYEEGKASGTSPETADEYAMCASFWLEWVKAAHNEGKLPAAAVPVLGKDLTVPDARIISLGWLFEIDETDEAEAAMSKYGAIAAGHIVQAFAGDADALRGVMGVLGACQPLE